MVGGERWVVEAPVGQVVVGSVGVPLLQRQVQRDFLPECVQVWSQKPLSSG